MKNLCKDFLFFNEKDKRAILILLFLIGIGSIISIYIDNFSTIDPKYFKKESQLIADFKTYADESADKTIFSNDVNTFLESETTSTKTSTKQRSSSKLTEGQLVNINTASSDVLIKIPGIGKTLADRIVEYRNEIGKFENTEQLLKIKGINNNKLSKILPYIVLADR